MAHPEPPLCSHFPAGRDPAQPGGPRDRGFIPRKNWGPCSQPSTLPTPRPPHTAETCPYLGAAGGCQVLWGEDMAVR